MLCVMYARIQAHSWCRYDACAMNGARSGLFFLGDPKPLNSTANCAHSLRRHVRGQMPGHAVQGTQGRVGKLTAAKSLAGFKVCCSIAAELGQQDPGGFTSAKGGIVKNCVQGQRQSMRGLCKQRFSASFAPNAFKTYMLGLGGTGRLNDACFGEKPPSYERKVERGLNHGLFRAAQNVGGNCEGDGYGHPLTESRVSGPAPQAQFGGHKLVLHNLFEFPIPRGFTRGGAAFSAAHIVELSGVMLKRAEAQVQHRLAAKLRKGWEPRLESDQHMQI